MPNEESYNKQTVKETSSEEELRPHRGLIKPRVHFSDLVDPESFTDRGIQCIIFNFTRDVSVGDGRFYFHIDERLDKLNLIDAHAEVVTAGTTGTTDIQIANVDLGVDILSTKLTIDSGETGSDTAAIPAVINKANAKVRLNQVLRIDVDATATTPAKGLIVTLGFG